jgi:hypothetical protein
MDHGHGRVMDNMHGMDQGTVGTKIKKPGLARVQDLETKTRENRGKLRKKELVFGLLSLIQGDLVT